MTINSLIQLCKRTTQYLILALTITLLSICSAYTKSNELQDIVLIQDVLSNGYKSIDIPVDSTGKELFVSIALDKMKSIVLVDPNGQEVTSDTPDVTFSKFTKNALINIGIPQPGMWKLKVTGTGQLSVSAKIKSEIVFYEFNFIFWSGVPHLGNIPIPGQPVAGTSSQAEAVIRGTYETADFKLISPSGQVIKSIVLSPQNIPDVSSLSGSVDIPTNPFRVIATGIDTNGLLYQRITKAQYTPQTVSISFENSSMGDFKEGINTLTFDITNHGDSDTFSITAIDNELGFIAEVEPTSLSLNKDETKSFTVGLNIPEDLNEDIQVKLTVTASSTSDPNIKNFIEVDRELTIQTEVFTLMRINIESSKAVQFSESSSGNLTVVGTYVLGEGNNGFDPTKEKVEMSFDAYEEEFLPGTFKQTESGFLYSNPSGEGVTKLFFGKKGNFKIQAKGIEFRGFDGNTTNWTKPIIFSIRIGNDGKNIGIKHTKSGKLTHRFESKK